MGASTSRDLLVAPAAVIVIILPTSNATSILGTSSLMIYNGIGEVGNSSRHSNIRVILYEKYRFPKDENYFM